MHPKLRSKSLWAAAGTIFLALLLTTNYVRHCATKPWNDENKTDPDTASTGRFHSAKNALRNDHPTPWLKIVVYHAITIATRLAA